MLVGHSMGAPVILYCLAALGDQWAAEHVDHVVLVAPAHVGSPCMLVNLAHSVVHNRTAALEQLFPGPVRVLKPLEDGLGDLCSSWACMAAEMPQVVGGVDAYPKGHVFATTPKRTYTIGQMGDFLADAAKLDAGRKLASALFPGGAELSRKMKAPPVPTHCVYCSKIDTIASMSYEDADVTKPCASVTNLPGDGTITSGSIETLCQAWTDGGADVKLVPCPEAVTHKNLIQDKHTINYVRGLVGLKPTR